MKTAAVLGVALASVLLAGAAHAQRRVGQVCPDPAHPCPGRFRPHELSFVLPRDSTARDEFRSEAFYAVILRSGPNCSIPERDRRAASSTRSAWSRVAPA
ncbi:MAG TPA: hypothetical protein VF771_05435 [Longimicrobiaceae bacterium]